MRKVFNFGVKIIFFLANTLMTLLCTYWILFFGSIAENSFQILLFAILIFLFLGIIWFLFFSKREIKTKVVIFFFAMLILYISFKIPVISMANKIDICLDKGGSWNYEKNICELAKKVTLQNGQQIVINKENCLQNKWIWHEEQKYCKLNTYSLEAVEPKVVFYNKDK